MEEQKGPSGGQQSAASAVATPAPGDRFLEEWPAELRKIERCAIHRRREFVGQESVLCADGVPACDEIESFEKQPSPGEPPGLPPHMLGVALSGGGIRSATLSLGFFQCLAKLKILPYVDYLSTVSGGGYFGSFLGQWFMNQAKYAQQTCPTNKFPRVHEGLANPNSEPVKYLRENGRYLAPVGSGDGLLLAAVYLRNLVSIHVILGIFALTFFVLANLLRAWALRETPLSSPLYDIMLNVPKQVAWIWWSPYLWVVVLVLWFLALPLGWAYWLVPGLSDKPIRRFFPFVATAVVLLASWGYRSCVPSELGLLASATFQWKNGVSYALFGPPIVAILFFLSAVIAAAYRAHKSNGMTCMEWTMSLRNSLSRWLRTTLVLAACLLAYAFIDSLGQTFYAVAQQKDGKTAYLAFLLPLLAAIVRYASVFLDSLPTRKAIKIPVEWIAAGASVVLGLAVLGLLSTVSHGFAWRWGPPAGEPGLHLKWSAPAQAASLVAQDDSDVLIKVHGSGHGFAKTKGDGRGMCLEALLILSALLVLFSILMGQTHSFVNHSSHHSYYAAHLIRAWLGASNPARRTKEGRRIAVPVPGDDISFNDYRPHGQGGPLHIINMTFNETRSGQSQVEQRDRKGFSMALSPFGITVGREHHAVWCTPSQKSTFLKRTIQSLRPGRVASNNRKPAARALRGIWPKEGFQVFPHDTSNTDYLKLTLGYWAGISGAAFSTGMGSRTSAGLSFLFGLINARLGYWWNSGVRPENRQDRTPPSFTVRLEALLTHVFPSQFHLLNEFLGRFHGPARIRWYLTDGGHLENTGCYELVRRRVPVILCMDNGADAGFGFGDIGELIRKVRIDFGAEIRFEPDRGKRKDLLRDFMAKDGRWTPFTGNEADKEEALVEVWARGSLEDLRPRVEKAVAKESVHKGQCAGLSCSLAHATVAFVYYHGQAEPGPTPDSKKESGAAGKTNPDAVILFVKSSVNGDEPLDVLTYKQEHAEFPHEHTADQFFDEAQWESYRKLGEHMAETLFARGG